MASRRRDSDWSGGAQNIALRFSERTAVTGTPGRLDAWSGGPCSTRHDTIQSVLDHHQAFSDKKFSAFVCRILENSLVGTVYHRETEVTTVTEYLHDHQSQPSPPLLWNSLCLAGSGAAHRG
jgi:hypothetical protein